MRLTLVMPSVGRKPGTRYIATWQMEPLILAVLAGLTPPEHPITVQDDRVEDLDFARPADLVALTLEAYTARRGYQIAAEYRRRGVKVVAGGFQATLVPDEVQQHVDAVVVGEAETVWPRVLADAAAGRLQPRYTATPGSDPWPAYQPRRAVYADKPYLPLALVEFSRGCGFACNFCSIAAFHHGRHRHRDPAAVAAEIKATGQKTVFLIDDNLASNRAGVLALCEAVRPLGVNWVSQISVDAAADAGLVRAMAGAGCMGVLIGFESLRPEGLKLLNKHCNRGGEVYARALSLLRNYHICVYATFLFGVDGDTPAAFRQTQAFVRQHRFFLTAFNHLVPFPGTPLYRQLERDGRLRTPAWWLDPDFRFGELPFHTRPLPHDTMARLCRDNRRKFYRWRSIVRRGLDIKTNAQSLSTLALFLTQNYLGRREVDEKFGLPLGFVDPIVKGG